MINLFKKNSKYVILTHESGQSSHKGNLQFLAGGWRYHEKHIRDGELLRAKGC